jgi:Ca2+-binding EF-hand superfamily protein
MSKSCIKSLREQLEKANTLFDSDQTKDGEKTRMLELIGELENKIRQQKFKKAILRGQV